MLPSEAGLQYPSNSKNNALVLPGVCPALFFPTSDCHLPRACMIECVQISAGGGTRDFLDLNRRSISVAVS